ncbi:MAG: hypothetical protein HFJ79_06665 [Clostridiales bacterium]|jgi:hypothetical protein|nr:hypothetical protein [Clostridiales bacterium]
MREDITSLPVSEVFEERDGCPICRMRDLLEQRVTDYITGAALMEPDVRVQTNQLGFCAGHYGMLLKKRNRLGVALMLETRLQEIEKQVFSNLSSPFGPNVKKQAESADKPLHTCFVCQQVDWAMERMLATVCRLWERESDFRRMYGEQPCLCLPHFAQVCAAAGHMGKKTATDFVRQSANLCRGSLTELQGDVSHFCKMFDYRSEGADWGNSRDSVERSIGWLTSRRPE